MIRVEIDTDNAAFTPRPGREIARILRRLARDFERDEAPRKLFDSNGNTIGTVDEAATA